jgi:uncharacterized membrane protein
VNQKTKRMLIAAGAAAAVGGVIYSFSRPKYSRVKLKKAILIDRSPADLYAFWRNFANLARLTDLLQSVEVLDDMRSRWTAAAPGEIPIQGVAEITKDLRDRMIAWRTIEGSAIETAGYVRFEPSRPGTLVRVALEYGLPAGSVGAALATLFGKRPGAHVEDLLRRFKHVMEAGESSAVEQRHAI